jgi:hypothetical protein
MTMSSVLVPQYMQTWCSTHRSSIVMSDTLLKSKTFPGPLMREV